ncbi:uncharacterized protein LTHEOB_6362 [Lasiodiplodia theobromae]|uniref:uncharacterized protein n=1 Tax=Lasiodiplodia theobromae TaxID=45133 RepID=UPI0015C35335|nr:uncharacterized protein LTHEOB_6362 [Lasiodiplodia theobromae]KAF4544244.1 hypothetical protein LTHEOB_6362 [Lasiodiplodia theobromae]
MKRTAREPISSPARKRFKVSSFPFTSLPVELRELIFEYVVESPEVLILPKYWLDDQLYGFPRRRLSLCHVPAGCNDLKDSNALTLRNTPYGTQSALRQKYRLAMVYPEFCRKCKSPECVPSGTVYRDPLLVSKAFLAEYGKVFYRRTTFVFNSGRTLNAFINHTRAIDLQEVRTLRIYFGRTFEYLAEMLCLDPDWMAKGAHTDCEDQKRFGEDSWDEDIEIRLLSGLRDLSLVNVVGDKAWKGVLLTVSDMKWTDGRWSGKVLVPSEEISPLESIYRNFFSTFYEFSRLNIRQVTVDVDCAWFEHSQPTQEQLERWRLTDEDKEEYKAKLLKIVTGGNEA